MARSSKAQKGGSRVKQNQDLLSYLTKITPRQQKMIISGLDRGGIETFAEICMNLLKGSINLTPAQIDKLRKYEESIYQLSLRSNSVAKKKCVLRQKGGFLSALLGLVPAIISGIIAATT